MIKKNFESLNKEMFQILISTLVRPHLEYAATIWSPYLKSQKDTIEKVQQRATKLIPAEKAEKKEIQGQAEGTKSDVNRSKEKERRYDHNIQDS